MALDTYDSLLGLILMGTGNDNNAWGTNLNNSTISPAARAIAGVNTITATGGNVDLSTVVPPAGLRADIDYIQHTTGALTSALTIIVPNVSKSWLFWNSCSGSFQTYVKVPGGVARTGPNIPGGLVHIPQGTLILVMCDGAGNLMRIDDLEIGSFCLSGKGATGPGELACNGASLLKTDFPDLYGKIGIGWGSVDSLHFTLPNFTDTNRFLRAAGGSLVVGTYQSNQNAAHTHTVTGAPSAGTLGTDSQGSHTHTTTVTDPGHTHAISPQAAPGGGNYASGSAIGIVGVGVPAVQSATTGISVSNASSGAHTHNITGAPGLGTLGTASQGGTEVRPESAAVTFGIRY